VNLNVVSFLDPQVYNGGGEMISRRLIHVGVGRGHDIRVSSVRPKKKALHASPNLTLLIDVFNFAHSIKSLGAWREFEPSFLESMIERAPFVHLTNAYVDVCNLPYLPCSGERLDGCPVKPTLNVVKRFMIRDWSDDCFARRAFVRWLYEASALNVYLSPLHRRVTESLLGSKQLPPSYLLKPMIDTKAFSNEQRDRDIDYLFVGVIGEAKGLAAMRERFRQTDIHLIGRCAPGIKPDFGRHLGHVSYDEVPRYMNRAKNFVFLPRWPEPQGRVVAEAALCGCRIIGNENVGALSFDMDLADSRSYEGVEDEFWARLEELAR
jgi:glycosyltransferase involved in cell wall biosynthesis